LRRPERDLAGIHRHQAVRRAFRDAHSAAFLQFRLRYVQPGAA
jgi:hypothetical protein